MSTAVERILQRLDDRCDRIERLIFSFGRATIRQGVAMNEVIAELVAAVEEDASLDNSLIETVERLAAAVEANNAAATDFATLKAKNVELAAVLRANSRKVADAVIAHTPAATPTPPSP